MNPGMACIKCHNQQGEGPNYSIAGTVYPTAHEPDKCNGKVLSGPAISTAIIEIIDKNGGVHTTTVNSVGNFGTTTFIAKPYTAKVKYDGRERVMTTPQTSGDCNDCHTQSGAQNAPGRVLLP
jgi:cytochrome c553